MTLRCPEPTRWAQLLDRDLPERDAHALRLHASGCESCRAQLEQTEQLLEQLATPTASPQQARVRRLISAVDALQTPPRHRLRWVAVALAVVAVLSTGVWLERPPALGTYAARGAPTPWQAKAHAELRALNSAAQPWSSEAHLQLTSPLAVWYRNLESERSLYLLAYLVDGEGEVHWAVPTYAPGQPPAFSALLPRADGAALFPDSFVADNPHLGAGELVTVISTRPLSVETIERAPPGARADPGALFSDAIVWRHAVFLDPEQP